MKTKLTNAISNVDADYSYSYQYDDIGNRVSSAECGVRNAEYVANELNQYTNITSQTSQTSQTPQTTLPEFDDDGNQTLIRTATGEWRVAYNGENRPVLWTCGTTNIVMEFDRKGRRSGAVVRIGCATNSCRRFSHDGYRCLQRIDVLNFPESVRFGWSPVDPIATRLLFMENDGLHSFLMFDGNKNVVVKVESDVLQCQRYEYPPFGTSHVSAPFGFSCEQADVISGLVLYPLRQFNPLYGVWTSRDRIGQPIVRHEYAGMDNSPISKIDLFGLASCCCGDCEVKIVSIGDESVLGYRIVNGNGNEVKIFEDKNYKDALKDELLDKAIGGIAKKARQNAESILFIIDRVSDTGNIYQPQVKKGWRVSYRTRKCGRKWWLFGECVWKNWRRGMATVDTGWVSADTETSGYSDAELWVAIFYDQDVVDKMKQLVRDADQAAGKILDKIDVGREISEQTGCKIAK